MSQPAPTVTRHPPEHDSLAAPQVAPAGCCCCCCCCCLHTMGGIAGSIVGSALDIGTFPARDFDPDAPYPDRYDVFEAEPPLLSPVLLYWLLVSLAVTVCVGSTPLWTGNSSMGLPEITALGLFVAVMIFPALQLAASLLAYIIVGIFYPERGYALKRLNRITAYSFLGILVGSLLMAGCWAAFAMR